MSQQHLPTPDAGSGPHSDAAAKPSFRLGPTSSNGAAEAEARDHGIIGRRIMAYGIDFALLLLVWPIAAVFSALSLFTLTPVAFALVPLVPLAYHTLLIGSKGSATLGMRAMGIRILQEGKDDGPDLPQAFIMTALFYLSLAASGLLLLWCLFDDRGRCLHDILSGTRTVRV